MSLPTIETASYELTLPSRDIKVKYRPFLVKEEKILLQAMESNKQEEILNALKDIVNACTYGQLNVSELPTFDLEYVFLQIRSKSVGEITKLKVLCPDDKKTYAQIDLDLTKVEVQVDDNHTNNIVIDENRKLGMILKYPTLDSVDPTVDFTKQKSSAIFDVIGKSIWQVYDGEKTFNASDYTKKELDEFIESLDSKTFVQVQKFYETMPKLKHEIEVTNPITQVKSKVTLQGTRFFRIALSHDTLENHFQVNFALMQHHKYSLTEINNMIPWEREIYVTLLVNHIKEENDKQREKNRGR